MNEDQARKLRVSPGSPCPYSGQYLMVIRGDRRKCTSTKGRRMPSGGAGTAGGKWRLTDATKHKRRA